MIIKDERIFLSSVVEFNVIKIGEIFEGSCLPRGILKSIYLKVMHDLIFDFHTYKIFELNIIDKIAEYTPLDAFLTLKAKVPTPFVGAGT